MVAILKRWNEIFISYTFQVHMAKNTRGMLHIDGILTILAKMLPLNSVIVVNLQVFADYLYFYMFTSEIISGNSL